MSNWITRENIYPTVGIGAQFPRSSSLPSYQNNLLREAIRPSGQSYSNDQETSWRSVGFDQNAFVLKSIAKYQEISRLRST